MPIPCRLRRAIHLTACLVLAGCVVDPPAAPAADPEPDDGIDRVVLLNPPTSVVVGQPVQLAVGIETDGVIRVGPVAWSSSATHVATVSATGYLTPLSAGTTTVTARVGTHSAATVISVRHRSCSGDAVPALLTVGPAVSDSIGATSCQFQDGRLATGRRIAITSPTTLVFEVSDLPFDAALLLTNATMGIFRTADTRGPGQAERLAFTFAAGTYYLWVTTRTPGERGRFALTASTAIPCSQQSTVGAISAGQTVTGLSSGTGCLLPNNVRGAGWRLSVAAPTALEVRVTGLPFTGAVVATTTAPELPIVAFGTRAPDGSVMFSEPFTPGEYLLWVFTQDDAEVPYSLSVNTTTVSVCGAPTQSIALTQSVTGTIDVNDCRVPQGRYAEVWGLELSASTTVRIDQTSNAFDAYLILQDSTGRLLAEDDDGGEGVNARLIRTLPAGRYRVVATTYSPGATGPYALSVQPSGGSAVRLDRAAANTRKPHRPW